MGGTGGPGPRYHVVVIGGGIAGLGAAWHLTRGGGDRVEVTVLEGARRVGGKLYASEVAGVEVDAGAEALLARRPEGKELVRQVGLGDELVDPGTLKSGIWSRGAIRDLPKGHVMGVPTDLAALAASGILSPGGLARASLDQVLPATLVTTDVSVAAYVRARMGGEVVDRLVEPLLGGVYAGRAETLSLDATMPHIAAAARSERSLLAAARAIGAGSGTGGASKAGAGEGKHGAGGASGGKGGASAGSAGSADGSASAGAARGGVAGSGAVGSPSTGPAGSGAAGGGSAGPVFTTLRGGLGRLPEAVAAASGATIRTGVMVRELTRVGDRWRLVTGSAREPEVVEADAVVVAVPAAPAARLFSAEVPKAAAELARVEYAGMAIVTLAYPVAAFPEAPSGSGYLVPPSAGRAVKAVTFSSVKWPHLARAAGDMVIVRCSIGRIGEEHLLQRDDAELVASAAAELAEVTGVRGMPADSRVTRWGGALPQYDVGHLDRVARVRAAVAMVPGLAVCGAAYDGVGVPACLATARTAAARILDHLDPEGQWRHDRRQTAAQGA
jgi:oxygen-dependent protoporphyrinogen oxidase